MNLGKDRLVIKLSPDYLKESIYMKDAKLGKYSSFNKICIVVLLSVITLKLYRNFDISNMLLSSLNTGLFSSNPISYNVWFIVDELIKYSIIVAFFYAYFGHDKEDRYVSFKKGFSGIDLIKAFAYVILISRVFGVLSEYIVSPLFKEFGLSLGDNVFKDEVENLSILDLVLGVVIIAPIFEEYIFRYLFLNKLKSFGNPTAILATSLLFGLMHLNLNQFIYTFPLGIILAYFAIETESIYLPILMHMLFNLSGNFELIFGHFPSLIFGLCMSVFLIYGIYLVIKLIMRYLKEKEEITYENGIYRTPGFLILLGFCLYFFFQV